MDSEIKQEIKDQSNLNLDEAMGLIEELSEEVRSVLNSLIDSHIDVDPRWHSIARTDLQRGFMALRRAVEQPDYF